MTNPKDKPPKKIGAKYPPILNIPLASEPLSRTELREAILDLKKPDKFLSVEPIEVELQDLLDVITAHDKQLIASIRAWLPEKHENKAHYHSIAVHNGFDAALEQFNTLLDDIEGKL